MPKYFQSQNLLGEVIIKYFDNKEKRFKIVRNFGLIFHLVISVTAYYFTSTVKIGK